VKHFLSFSLFAPSAADLTPTPTRLLNKCEELRVFEDPYLQNLNPFDEGFRNAIDNRDSGFLSASPSTNQDTLHTPQIIPDFIARNIKDERVHVDLPMQDEPENLSTTPDVISNIPKIIIGESPPQPIPLLPKPSVIYAAPLITTANSSGLPLKDDVKHRLKTIIMSNSSSNSSFTTTSLTESNKRAKIDADTKLNLPAILIQTVPLIAPANLILNNSNINNNNNSNSAYKGANSLPKVLTEVKRGDNDNSTKKKSSTTSVKGETATLKVERNRAAARRYRHKMKIQGQAMRDKYDKGQKEIAQLKKEITELKRLLLLHKDCEVTKRLNLAN
jgi:cyclic AMP-dependent transcription factor ATF-2